MLLERVWFRRVTPRHQLCVLLVLLEALIQRLQTWPRVHHAASVSLANTPRRPAASQQTSPAPCALLATCALIQLQLRILDALPIRFVQLEPQLKSSVLSGPTALTTPFRSHVRSVPSALLAPSVHLCVRLARSAAVHQLSKRARFQGIALLVPRLRVLVLKVSSAAFRTPRQPAMQRTIVLRTHLLRHFVFKISTALTLTLRLPVLPLTIVQPVLSPKPSALSDPIAQIFTLKPLALLAVIVLLVRRLLSHVLPDFIVPLLLRRQHAQPTTSVSPASLLPLPVPFVLLETTRVIFAPLHRMLFAACVPLASTIRLRPTRSPAPHAASVLSASMSLQRAV